MPKRTNAEQARFVALRLQVERLSVVAEAMSKGEPPAIFDWRMLWREARETLLVTQSK